MNPPRPSMHRVLRLANSVGAAATAVGLVRDYLHADALIERACRAAGLSDLGDPSFRPALDALVRSCRQDARLHFLGHRHMCDLIERALITRLRLVAAVHRDPGVDRAPLRPPLVICGLPRSGTTLLHRLLALAEQARALCLWELMDPLPGPGPDRRRAEVEVRMARLRRFASANIDAQHYMRADLPDECGHLFKPSFLSALYWMVPVTGYLAYFPQHDARPAYLDYRRLLVLLQRDAAQRYVLKDPFHALNLPALLSAIPDAMVVQTHRAPSEVVPSLHKLALTTQSVFTASPDTAHIIDTNTTWLATVAERSVRDRERLPKERILDIAYRDLVADPVGTVHRVHSHFGLPWSTELAARLAAFVSDNGQRRHGENPYAAEDFGQTMAAINARFAAYRERFAMELG